MSSTQQLLLGEGAGGPVTYVEDVFSTDLYTGTGSSVTVTNGIDLATKGGLVWIKQRDFANGHLLGDTVRGAGNYLQSNTTGGNAVDATAFASFNTNGFSTGAAITSPAKLYASWTFREQAKFFDIVTYTGDGTSNRDIPHSLGSAPGCVIVKPTSTTGSWQVNHQSCWGMDPTYNPYPYVQLNTTSGLNSDVNIFPRNCNTSTTSFRVGSSATVNGVGVTYEAYVFASNAGGFGLTGADSIITCGTYTGNYQTTNLNEVNLGFEAQWVLLKPVKDSSSATPNWYINDTTRAMTNSGGSLALFPNTNETETGAGSIAATSTGFRATGSVYNEGSARFVYIAIRKGPMKTPTDATTVFTPVAYTGTNVDNRLVNTGILTDMVMARIRSTTSSLGFVNASRLFYNNFLGTASTAAESGDADSIMTPTVGYGYSFSAMNGFGVGNDVTRQLNQSSTAQLAYAFKRAPGFFDEVCYTGTGITNRTVTHNLGVAPQLLLVKAINNIQNWSVLCTLSSGLQGRFNTTDAFSAPSAAVWGNGSVYVAPTASVFTVGTDNETNASTWTYVSYLFATLAGVSKVGSYTGTGATQTIDCGFVGGARFVLIKRTDNPANWFVWDTARGMVAGTDPSLAPNSTPAEVNANSIYTTATGFQIVSTATGINGVGESFIYLAIA